MTERAGIIVTAGPWRGPHLLRLAHDGTIEVAAGSAPGAPVIGRWPVHDDGTVAGGEPIDPGRYSLNVAADPELLEELTPVAAALAAAHAATVAEHREVPRRAGGRYLAASERSLARWAARHPDSAERAVGPSADRARAEVAYAVAADALAGARVAWRR